MSSGASWKHAVAAAACCLLQAPTAFAQPTDSAARAAAIDLFDAAESLMKSGRVAEACPKYAESYRLDPQLGALLHLADCLEREGRLAGAYAAFRDGVELAARKHDERERYAAARSEQLVPRLGRIAVDVPPAAQVPGLRVMLGPILIDRGSFGVGIAVDPGRHRIEATAPGRETYRVEVEIEREGQLEHIALPALAPLFSEKSQPPPPRPKASATLTLPRDASTKLDREPTGLHTAGLVTAGAGVVALGVGVGFLVDMFATLDERDSMCPHDPCSATTDRSRVRALEASARRSQLLGLTFSTLGGAAMIGGATMAWIVPRVDASAAGGQRRLRLQLEGTF